MTFEEAVQLRNGDLIKSIEGRIAIIIQAVPVLTPKGVRSFRLPKHWTVLHNDGIEQIPAIQIFERWDVIENGYGRC